MLRDDDDFPPPQKLPKELDQWRAPGGGLSGRSTHLALAMESYFAQSDRFPDAFKPYQILEMLSRLLGDHRATVVSYMKARDVRGSTLGWRFQQYVISLQCMLSWLATEQAWNDLGPIGSTHFSIDAYRGGGSRRRLVWCFEWGIDGKATLRVRTDHFVKGEADRVNDLVSQFMRNSADAAASYGRAGLVYAPELRQLRYPEPIFEPPARLELWLRALADGAPAVPWVHRVNLLDSVRLEQLGGVEVLKPLIVKSNGLHVESHGKHAIVWTRRLATHLFDDYNDSSDGDEHLLFQEAALLHLFAKAGMLAVQHLGWTESAIDGWRLEQDPSTRSRPSPQHLISHRPMDEWIQKLQARPPRWVAPCAATPSATLPGKLAEQFHAGYTHFALTPTPGKAALTLYGSPTGDPVLIGSPVVIGSPKRERARAVFDETRDGWDACAMADEDRPPLQHQRLRQFKCPSCDGRFFQLRAVFEYPPDLDDLPESEQTRAEEYFTWVWLIATCSACTWTGIAADIECA